jgi:hypothetical protein
MSGTNIVNSVILRRFTLKCKVAALIIVSLSLHAESDGEKTDKKTAAPQAAKSHGLSADVYEKEDSITSFSAHVNMIRETDVIEVFFDGKNKGPYLLKDDPNLGAFKERLAKSQKNKNQTVTVKVNDDVITNVELTEIKAVEKKKSDLDSVLSDILKK